MHPEKASTKDVLNLSTNHLARRTAIDEIETSSEVAVEDRAAGKASYMKCHIWIL